jgi:hypothetical protein
MLLRLGRVTLRRRPHRIALGFAAHRTTVSTGSYFGPETIQGFLENSRHTSGAAVPALFKDRANHVLTLAGQSDFSLALGGPLYQLYLRTSAIEFGTPVRVCQALS